MQLIILATGEAALNGKWTQLSPEEYERVSLIIRTRLPLNDFN